MATLPPVLTVFLGPLGLGILSILYDLIGDRLLPLQLLAKLADGG